MPSNKSKPEKQSKQPPTGPFVSESAEACFLHFASLLAAAPPASLERCNADPEIARVNIGRGVDALRPHMARVAEALPLLDGDRLLELPALARAFAFAADRVFVPASPQEIRARQQRLRPARSTALRYLEIAAELGLVPRDRVASIRANNGPVDEARDGVAITALFNEHAPALKGKHPFTEASLAQLAEDGDWLLAQLLPKGANPERPEQGEDARVRDMLWTELLARYDELYQAGMAVWGRRKVDEYIPALLSRAAVTRSKGAPAPAEPPAVAPPA